MSLISTSEKTNGPRLAAIPRYLSALISQGLVSGFHFVLNLVLVTLLSASDFGLYALVFVLAYTATSVTNALFATPLQVYAPSASSLTERMHIQSMLTTLMFLLLGVCLMLGVLGAMGLSSLGSNVDTVITGIGFVLAYVVRQYSRAYGYARFDVIAVLFGDMTYVVVGGVILSIMFMANLPIEARDVFIALTAANLISVLIEIARLPRENLDLMTPLTAVRAYRPIWVQSRWALIGAVTTIFVQQAHTAVVVALKNPESDAKRQMVIVSALSVGSVLVIAALMQLAWPWLDQWLYQTEYKDEPMRMIVLMWAAITVIGAVQNGPYTALQSLKLFQPLAIATVYGALLGFALVTVLVVSTEISWSLLGVLAAETFVAIWVSRLVLNKFKTLQTPDTEVVA